MPSKYYDLALSMWKNRCDWSEGYDYVKNELDSFEVDNETDKKIFDELKEILENAEEWGVDGRQFRDCDHNYDWIAENLFTPEDCKAWKERVFE